MKLKKPKDTWIYKIGAVILALLFWLYVMQVQNPTVEQIYYVPLEARSLDESLVMTEQNIQIEVRVQGSKEVVSDTSAKDIHVYADFTNVGGVGDISLQVLPVLPESLQLVSINPASVTVGIEEITSRTFQIGAKVPDNAIAYGFIALEPVISPAEVIIAGASSALDSISEVYVNIPINNINTSYNQKLPVQVINNEGKLLNDNFSLVPEVADVIIPVVSDLPDKLLTLEVPVYGSPASGYILSRIVLEPEAVRVFGSFDALNELKSIKTATADISGATQTITQELEVYSPEGVSLPENEKTVRAILVIEPIDFKDFRNLAVQTRNLTGDYEVKMANAYIDIEVKGPKSAVEGLSVTDIIPYIDCAGLKAGSYTLPVQIIVPSNITLIKASVEEMTIEINRIK